MTSNKGRRNSGGKSQKRDESKGKNVAGSNGKKENKRKDNSKGKPVKAGGSGGARRRAGKKGGSSVRVLQKAKSWMSKMSESTKKPASEWYKNFVYRKRPQTASGSQTQGQSGGKANIHGGNKRFGNSGVKSRRGSKSRRQTRRF